MVIIRQRGFSLVEMAVVIVILGFVIAALVVPVTAQREIAFIRQTEIQLELAQKALIGFAQAKGRLPCPATTESRGMEVIQQSAAAGGGACNASAQFLPAVTLGLRPVNESGQAVDGWGNPILYRVDQSNQGGVSTLPDFTSTNEMMQVGMAGLRPSLRVCASVTNCSDTNYLINNAVVVVYSLGSTGAQVLAGGIPGGADEQANLDFDSSDNIFISHDIRANDPNGSFNHIVTWISPYILYNAMIQAGQLP